MEAMQPALAVLLVLGLLGAALYYMRGRGMARFNTRGFGRPGTKQMQAIERLALTPQHSLHLVSVAGRVMLIAVSPGGCTVLDGVSLPASTEIPGGQR